MSYVDGFVLPVPKRNIRAYVRLSRRAGKVFKEYGALEYRECVGDDLAVKGVLAFPRMARVKRGETVIFSWVVYRSRAHRDRVNAKIMKDPRMASMGQSRMPFDVKRMAYGGFRPIVTM